MWTSSNGVTSRIATCKYLHDIFGRNYNCIYVYNWNETWMILALVFFLIRLTWFYIKIKFIPSKHKIYIQIRTIPYLRIGINDLVLWALIWVLLPSSFIFVSKNVIFHLQRPNSSSWQTVEKTTWYMATCKKTIYIDKGYKLASRQKRQMTKRY